MRGLKQRQFLTDPRFRSVIWVDPTQVRLQLGSKWPVGRERLNRLERFVPGALLGPLRAPIKHAEPFEIPARHFSAAIPVRDTQRYRRIADALDHADALQNSLWFHQMRTQLRDTGAAYYKTRALHSEAEILAFLRDDLLGLVESMRENGFDGSRTGYESTAVIMADGSLCKTGSGNHRFCIAKLIGLDRFPLQVVGAHEAWVKAHLPPSPTVEDVLALLPEVEAHNSAPAPAGDRVTPAPEAPLGTARPRRAGSRSANGHGAG